MLQIKDALGFHVIGRALIPVPLYRDKAIDPGRVTRLGVGYVVPGKPMVVPILNPVQTVPLNIQNMKPGAGSVNLPWNNIDSTGPSMVCH